MLLLLLLKEIIAEEAISYEDGNLLYEKISDSMKKTAFVELDFAGITSITTTFLTASIGQLYAHFSDDEIARRVKIKNLNEDYENLLSEVIKRFKEFQNNPTEFEDTINDVIYGA